MPLISLAVASKRLNLTFPTVTASPEHLERLRIARETTGSRYGRLYAYDRYLRILNTKSLGFQPLAFAPVWGGLCFVAALRLFRWQ